MAQIPQSLRDQCRLQPEGVKNVIVTLREDVPDEAMAELGLPEPTRLTDGVYKTRLNGKQVLEFGLEEKIAEIIEDAEDEMMI